MSKINFYTKNINGVDVKFVKMWDRYGYEYSVNRKNYSNYVYAPNTEKNILNELEEEVKRLI